MKICPRLERINIDINTPWTLHTGIYDYFTPIYNKMKKKKKIMKLLSYIFPLFPRFFSGFPNY